MSDAVDARTGMVENFVAEVSKTNVCSLPFCCRAIFRVMFNTALPTFTGTIVIVHILKML